MTTLQQQHWAAYEKTRDTVARNALVETYLPIVRAAAQKLAPMMPFWLDVEDLESAGVTGLIDAIRNYQRSRGVRFETYCVGRISGAIMDQVRLMDHLTRNLRTKVRRVEKAARELQRTLGRPPTECELAEHMGRPVEEICYILQRAGVNMYSLDMTHTMKAGGKPMQLTEHLTDERGVDPVEAVQLKDLVERVASLLSPVERQVIIMYYYDQLTMRQIGKMLDLTESRVCQIHSDVLKRLRAVLG